MGGGISIFGGGDSTIDINGNNNTIGKHNCTANAFNMIANVKAFHDILCEEDKRLFKFASDGVKREKETLGNTELFVHFPCRPLLIVRSGGEMCGKTKRVHVGFNDRKEPEWSLSVDEYAVPNFHGLSDAILRVV